jgi:hypothetical protein
MQSTLENYSIISTYRFPKGTAIAFIIGVFFANLVFTIMQMIGINFWISEAISLLSLFCVQMFLIYVRGVADQTNSYNRL